MKKSILFLASFCAASILLQSCKVIDAIFRPSLPPAGGYTFMGGVPSQAGVPTGLNQNTLIIYTRASDNATPNLNTLRTSEQGEFGNVNTFFLESSFDKTSFNYTHAPNTGWYSLPNSYDAYMWTDADVVAAQATGNAAAIQQANDGQALVQDFWGFFTNSLQAAVDDGFNVGSFTQVCVVIIGPFHRGTSYGTTNFTLQSADRSSTFQVALPVVVVSTNTRWSRTAHEFGHAFGGFADLYGAPNRGMGNWDLMDCTDCTNQTTGWHKDKRASWFSGSLASIARPVGTTQIVRSFTLVPYEKRNPSAGEVQSIRLDVGSGTYLYIENRQQISGQFGSQLLPANAVIITDAIDNTGDINASRPPILLFGGPIPSGNSFTDNTYGPLKVEVTGTNPNLNVKVTWGPDPYFDLVINPWNPPPYESPDIWIDSQSNGWDSYENNSATSNPSVPGNPILNGDKPWVGRDNRVYARVHNTGSTDVTNATVNYYITTPPGIGDVGNWSLLDRTTIPFIGAGTSVVAPPAKWRPSSASASHTCIIARVDRMPQELNANNNEGQENVDEFNTSQSSPWKKINGEVQVSNPTNLYQTLRVEMRGLPSEWTGWVSQRFISLAPKETKKIKYIIDPNGGKPQQDQRRFEEGARFSIHIEGWLLKGDQDVLVGGVTNIIKAVYKTDKVEIIDYPKNEDSQERGKVSVLVQTFKPVNNSFTYLTTLEVTEISSNKTQVIYEVGSFTSSGQKSIVDFYLERFIATGRIQLNPGQEYKVIAYLNGNNFLEGGIESKPIKFKYK